MRNVETDEQNKREAKADFLVELAKHGTVLHAAATARVSRTIVYRWRKEDEAFAEEWDETVEKTYDTLEQSLYERAVDGVEEPVFYQGSECGHVKRYSDTAAIFLLKGGRPEKFRDRHEHTGANGGPIQVAALKIEIVQSRNGAGE